MPTCPKATTSAPENPEKSGNLDCIDEDDNGSDYAGKATVTVTGATCNKWSDADLGNWAYGSMGEYKKLPGNFCRNPDNSKLPWCFVAGTKDSYYQGAEGRAFCDVPACPADPTAPTCREFLILRFLVQQNTALFSTFRPSSVLCHRRDISTFLEILTVYTMKTIYFLNAYHLGW